MDAKAVLTSMLAEADIRVGGDRPWDIRVHNEGLYKRVLREGTLGAGEAYLEGWWDCDQLDVMFCTPAPGKTEHGSQDKDEGRSSSHKKPPEIKSFETLRPNI